MEHLDIRIDDGTGRAFDEALKGTLPDGGDLAIITKNKGTEQGNPIAIMTFTVRLPDGTMAKAQTVTTVALLRFALSVIIAKYPGK